MESDKQNRIFDQWEEVIKSWLMQPRERRLELMTQFPALFEPVNKASQTPVAFYTDIMQSFHAFEDEKLHVLAESPELYQTLIGLSAAIVKQNGSMLPVAV